MAAVTPKCERLNCGEEASTVREVVKDGERVLYALCAADAADLDLRLDALRVREVVRDEEIAKRRIEE